MPINQWNVDNHLCRLHGPAHGYAVGEKHTMMLGNSRIEEFLPTLLHGSSYRNYVPTTDVIPCTIMNNSLAQYLIPRLAVSPTDRPSNQWSIGIFAFHQSASHVPLKTNTLQ